MTINVSSAEEIMPVIDTAIRCMIATTVTDGLKLPCPHQPDAADAARILADVYRGLSGACHRRDLGPP
ncbi:hypothetical protein V1281_005908 [Nitrobacteraceae bacterium AZCC 2161]